MKLWVDAQLPPQLAEWLVTEFRVEASSVRQLGLRDAADLEIFQQARQAGAVLVSKDADFVELVARYGAPPQLPCVTCGNVTNQRLQTVFRAAGNAALQLLAEGQAIVEIC